MSHPDYENYAMIIGGEVVTRHSMNEPWKVKGWSPELAREYARYIIKLADQIERGHPVVKQLISDLEVIEESPDSTLEDIAVGLFKKGYHK